jgi:hypothetical protein
MSGHGSPRPEDRASHPARRVTRDEGVAELTARMAKQEGHIQGMQRANIRTNRAANPGQQSLGSWRSQESMAGRRPR